MGQSVKLKRSAVVNNNAPKLPTSEQIDFGELAVNFAEGHETLSIKNSNSGITTFSSDSVLDRKYISSGAAVSAITEHVTDAEVHLPEVTAEDNGKIMMVSGGQWTLSMPLNVYSGNGTPSNILGNNGDIYVQTS